MSGVKAPCWPVFVLCAVLAWKVGDIRLVFLDSLVEGC